MMTKQWEQWNMLKIFEIPLYAWQAKTERVVTMLSWQYAAVNKMSNIVADKVLVTFLDSSFWALLSRKRDIVSWSLKPNQSIYWWWLRYKQWPAAACFCWCDVGRYEHSTVNIKFSSTWIVITSEFLFTEWSIYKTEIIMIKIVEAVRDAIGDQDDSKRWLCSYRKIFHVDLLESAWSGYSTHLIPDTLLNWSISDLTTSYPSHEW